MVRTFGLVLLVVGIFFSANLGADEAEQETRSYYNLRPCSNWTSVRLSSGQFGYICSFTGGSAQVPVYNSYVTKIQSLESRIRRLESRLAELE